MNIFENPKAKKLVISFTIAMIIMLSTAFIVDQRQQVLVVRLGEPIRTITEPGINFKVPFIEEAIFLDKRIMDLEMKDREVIASDQKRLIINAFTKYKIIDPLKFYTTVNNVGGLGNKLSAILDSSLRQVIGEVTLSQLLTENRADIMQNIRTAVIEQSEIFGIEIVDVRIMRADLPHENSEAIFARMQTEREKEAREIRANGAEESDKIRAEADKKKAILLAEANKNSDILRGKGEGKANYIYRKAYGRDPEFAAFYRSMIAYQNSFSAENTKMVISPDSEFFQYFNRD